MCREEVMVSGQREASWPYGKLPYLASDSRCREEEVERGHLEEFLGVLK